MRITLHRSFLAAIFLLAVHTGTVVFAQDLVQSSDASPAESVVVTYNPADGHLAVQGNDLSLTTIELSSLSGGFLLDQLPEGAFQQPFDVATSSKLFHLNTAGFRELDLGTSLAPGLTADELINDLKVDGSILPRGALSTAAGGGPFLFLVPEPASLTLFGIGLLLSMRRLVRSR